MVEIPSLLFAALLFVTVLMVFIAVTSYLDSRNSIKIAASGIKVPKQQNPDARLQKAVDEYASQPDWAQVADSRYTDRLYIRAEFVQGVWVLKEWGGLFTRQYAQNILTEWSVNATDGYVTYEGSHYQISLSKNTCYIYASPNEEELAIATRLFGQYSKGNGYNNALVSAVVEEYERHVTHTQSVNMQNTLQAVNYYAPQIQNGAGYNSGWTPNTGGNFSGW
jgi:hypothetical protein